MYIYKALVGCLPYVNKMKLVRLINQYSDEFIECKELMEYDYGIICQTHGSYAGVFLVKVHSETDRNACQISHFGLIPEHRGNGHGMDMITVLKDERGPGGSIVVNVPANFPTWKLDKLKVWGFHAMENMVDGNKDGITYILYI